MNERRSVVRWLRVALVAVAVLLLAACKEAGPEPVDPALLAFLSAARSAHHKADIAERLGDPGAAIGALETLVGAPRPGRGAEPPEVAEVLADSRARLADLRSQAGQFEPALADVEAGLGLVPGVTYFRGHLVEVRGLVYERRAEVRLQAGDAAGAAADRKAALDAFDEAIAIQGEVIERALGSDPP